MGTQATLTALKRRKLLRELQARRQEKQSVRQRQAADLDEQQQRWLEDWERQNGTLPGRHVETETAEAPVTPTPKRRTCPRTGAAELLLDAARREFGDGRAFGLSALVLAAWNAFPRAFGLAGCEAIHPSDNKVRTVLYGRRGLIARGAIEALEDGTFRVKGGDA